MITKPSIPKGTRDFSPEVLKKRYHIFDVIRNVYKSYGFLPIETPSMEQIETLTGKYGNEGDKLLFRILNSGDFVSKVEEDLWNSRASSEIAVALAEKGLRYDLTVPFARYVVQHRDEITFPFRRYQIQPVWRADRPQKGRYREFYQCDADVIGSDSLLCEFELTKIIDQVFDQLNINVVIRLNNRKILWGLAEASGLTHCFYEFTTAIDKLDKTGIEKVLEELSTLGMQSKMIEKTNELFTSIESNEKKIAMLSTMIETSETGLMGIVEMQKVLGYLEIAKTKNPVIIDLTLARGLNYYTGTIFEVNARDAAIGSICGGGRYDDLTGIFGYPGLSGVGISFGADRIYDVMHGLNLFEEIPSDDTRVMMVNFGGEDEIYSIKAVEIIRASGTSAEIYPEAAKIKKQMSYAAARKIPFVVLAGENERKSGHYTLKDMHDSSQSTLTLDEIISTLKK